MTLKEAKALRDEIRATGPWCTVPLGFGPDRYFARIITDHGPKEFTAFAEYEAYRAGRDEERRKAEMAIRLRSRPRSPLDMMIDKACGLD